MKDGGNQLSRRFVNWPDIKEIIRRIRGEAAVADDCVGWQRAVPEQRTGLRAPEGTAPA